MMSINQRFTNFLPKIRALSVACVVTLLAITSQSAFSAARQGPSGGTGGSTFSDLAGANEVLELIQVRHGTAIDAVRLCFRNTSTGAFRFAPHRGGSGGILYNISLAPGEKINYISGYYGDWGSIQVVRKLYVVIISRVFSFGSIPAGSRYFCYSNPNLASMNLDGLTGASGALVDALGVYWE